MSDPLLLTPGPLTTAPATRAAMGRDLGSREAVFVETVARIRRGLLQVVDADEDWTAVLLQGSGTFAIEATLGTLVGVGERLLVLVNGAYGRRMVDIARVLGIDVVALDVHDLAPVDPEAVDRALAADPRIRHVAVVHCETTSGMLNPLEAIEAVVARHGRALIVDAMSSFGALPLRASGAVEAIVSSANKALEGVPGVSFVLCPRAALGGAGEPARSWSLDLRAQWERLEHDGQFRTTPPTHVLLALDTALTLLADEGGPSGRLARYSASWRVLVDGLRARGLSVLVPDAVAAPIIVSVAVPQGWTLPALHAALLPRGFAIYPGKLANIAAFRVGCIGQVTPGDIHRFLAALDEVLP